MVALGSELNRTEPKRRHTVCDRIADTSSRSERGMDQDQEYNTLPYRSSSSNVGVGDPDPTNLPNGSTCPTEITLTVSSTSNSVLKHRHTTSSSQTSSKPHLCAHCSKNLARDTSHFRLIESRSNFSAKADIVLLNSTDRISHEESSHRDMFEELLIKEYGLAVQKIRSFEKDCVYTVISGSWEGVAKAAEQTFVSMALNRKYVKKFPKKIHRVRKRKEFA